MLVCAKVVLPVRQQPIEDGAVLIRNGVIQKAGPRRHLLGEECSGNRVCLGDAVVFPGFVNAHCHLDYSGMAGMISSPRSFPDWVKMLLALKSEWGYTEYAVSWLNGAQALLSSGVTAVADIEAVPELLPDVLGATPLRVCSLLEMTGVKSRRPAEVILGEALQIIDSLGASGMRHGLSPHAPYSTAPDLLQLAGLSARQRGLRLSTHLAESVAEFEMYMDRSGQLYQWLKSQRDMSDCGGISPVQHAWRQGLLSENLIAVHVNYLAKSDAQLLGQANSHVAHCPRSHQYFAHRKFPLEELQAAGVNVCLGTDSMASVKVEKRQKPRFDFFEEMRVFSSAFPRISPAEIVKMATMNGALALGLEGRAGELTEGSWADLAAIPFHGELAEAEAAVLHHSGPVQAVMVGGRWVKGPYG